MIFYTGNKEIDSYLWNQGVMQIFPGRYTYEQLNDAYNKLVCANDSLRIKIEYTDQGCILLLKNHHYKNYPHWVLSSEAELEKKAQEFLNEPIDFNGDLVKCAIFETPNASGIMISGHHMFVDGYSVSVMTDHINKYLENPEYTPPAYQKYSEYISNEEKHKNSKRYKTDYSFWEKAFATLPTCSIFTDSNTLNYYASEINVSISSNLFNKIKALCIKENFSVQTFFNTIYASYFYKVTNLNKFTLGVPVLNRTTTAEFNTIGIYMHIVPLVSTLR